jgi:Kef-type K+ transport system membrane component KefB
MARMVFVSHPLPSALLSVLALAVTVTQRPGSCCCEAFQSHSPPVALRRRPSTTGNTLIGHRKHPADTSQTQLQMMFPDFDIPFQQLGRQLSDTLNIGSALSRNAIGNVPEAATSMVMDSIGRDLLVFLTASVIVTPVATAIGVTPILGYLLAGALLGPHGMDFFANSKADVELGDFGILFLLFSEGLEVSTARLKQLTNFLPLGLAQISLTAASLSAAIYFLPDLLDRFLPLDTGLINVKNPAEALVLALAGTLSTSAFIFPVLKEREWEEDESGQAATSILLLQDLAVAPLLVLLPYIVGQDVTDYGAIGFLTAKATFGFGSVVVAGSFVLRQLFRLVAQAQSTETFVALCLLVSVGMGVIAKELGLTDTAGAFAAGVLLANTNYRAQIQADILPFKGILLGIFFMDAGSSFDLDLVMSEWPTIVTGSFVLIALKAVTLLSATRVPRWLEPNRLPLADGIRIALLLAGGGEFAFVVLALAEKLNVLPVELGGLLTAIVLITMAVTPLLGELAGLASGPFVTQSRVPVDEDFAIASFENEIAKDAIVVCGYGTIGRKLLEELEKEHGGASSIVAFDTDPTHPVDTVWRPSKETVVLFGDAGNAQVIRNSGVTDPSAIFISYDEYPLILSATYRLRAAFRETPIYARARTREEAQSLEAAGATQVIVESDELSRSAVALMRGRSPSPELRQRAAIAAGVTPDEADRLLELYDCMDTERFGLVEVSALSSMLRQSNKGIASDEEFEEMEHWLETFVPTPIGAIEFCRVYATAPAFIKDCLSDACLF